MRRYGSDCRSGEPMTTGPMPTERTTIVVDDATVVSAIVTMPSAPRAAYVFAHGAGAGMDHAFMAAFAAGLAARDVGTLRFNFPFIERGSGRVDGPSVAHATVRVAVRHAVSAWPGVPLFAGGKSFGGRMTSQAEAVAPLGVAGIVFVGFPLHPADRPSTSRAEHLAGVAVPTLFLQGTRDALADAALIRETVERVGPTATLALYDDADHAFHVRKKSGRDDAAVMAAMLDETVGWMTRIVDSR